MKGRGQAVIRQEQGYALASVLLLVAILLVIGTLVMQSVTNSQGMVNVSEDIVSAQADGETKLLIKLSELRAAVMALKDKDKLTLDDVKAAADKYVEPGTVTLDNENQRYIAIVKADGVSDQVTQTYRRKVEITLSFTPGNPSPGTGTGGYAVVSYGALTLNEMKINGNVYSHGSVANNRSVINGVLVSPTLPGGTSLKSPEKINFSTVFSKVNSEAAIVKNKYSSGNYPDLTINSNDSNTTRSYSQTTVFNNVNIHRRSTIDVHGDLIIRGHANISPGTLIKASGNIFFFENVTFNGSLSADGYIWTAKQFTFQKSDVNRQSTVEGDMYIGGEMLYLAQQTLNVDSDLVAGNLYSSGAVNPKLSGADNQFMLYADGSVTMDSHSSSAVLNGSIYSNGAIAMNGNGGLTINGTTSPPATPEKPSEIKFEEKNIVIN
jgi:hypothetical protein